MKISIDSQVELNVPAERAWDILWNNYEHVGQWATIIPESAPRYHDQERVGRVCSSTYGDVKEIISGHDATNMTYSYEADGLPKMFISGKNKWSVTRVNEIKSIVDMQLRMEMSALPGFFMGWMIRSKMRKDIDGLMEDLKHFAETGMPHPRKEKSIEKWEKYKARKAA